MAHFFDKEISHLLRKTYFRGHAADDFVTVYLLVFSDGSEQYIDRDQYQSLPPGIEIKHWDDPSVEASKSADELYS